MDCLLCKTSWFNFFSLHMVFPGVNGPAAEYFLIKRRKSYEVIDIGLGIGKQWGKNGYRVGPDHARSLISS